MSVLERKLWPNTSSRQCPIAKLLQIKTTGGPGYGQGLLALALGQGLFESI